MIWYFASKDFGALSFSLPSLVIQPYVVRVRTYLSSHILTIYTAAQDYICLGLYVFLSVCLDFDRSHSHSSPPRRVA